MLISEKLYELNDQLKKLDNELDDFDDFADKHSPAPLLLSKVLAKERVSF